MPSVARVNSTVLSTSVDSFARGDGAPSTPDAALRQAVGDTYGIAAIDVSTVVKTHLDTADWRLRRAGIDLVFVRKSGLLVAQRGSSPPIEQPAGSIGWPALVSALPDGPVRELISGPVWIRALLPFATSEERSHRFEMLNEDEKTVVRVNWSEASILAPKKGRLPLRVEVDPLRGYESDAAKVARLLTAETTLSTTSDTRFAALSAKLGAGRPATDESGTQRTQAADRAVADALLGYLDAIEATFEGIITDIDTEYLHDFRVTVRRTRSVLKLVGDVLPDTLAARMGDEFRWLGKVTSTTRDLDVYILGMDDLTRRVARPSVLDPFAAFVRARRAAEHRTMVRALRSARFVKIGPEWRAELAAVGSVPLPRPATVAQLADERLRRAFRKAAKRAKAIARESPAEEVHSLRKACKDMRYLLEAFKPLCDPIAYADVITDFKKLQTVLGDFQDGEVQAAALRQFAQEMMATGTVDTDTLLAMGELSAGFEARQHRAREILTKHHEEYLGKKATGHVKRLVAS